MGLKDELHSEVGEIVKSAWTKRLGIVLPRTFRSDWATIRSAVSQRFIKLKHVVGTDMSELFVAKRDIRDSNGYGVAAIHAAKVFAMPDRYQMYVTEAVFDFGMIEQGACDSIRCHVRIML